MAFPYVMSFKTCSFILLVIPQYIHSLVPHDCVHNVSSVDKTCCPVPLGYSVPCGGIGRGSCDYLDVRFDEVETIFEVDDRLNWPIKFFKRMCRCEGNYFGIACETCWYGWQGKHCDRRVTIERRNIFSFSDKEKELFLNILQMSYKTPSEYMILNESDTKHSDPLFKPRFIPATFQQYIAFIHRYASRATLFKDAKMCKKHGSYNFNHNTASFATWHRGLMLHWERELGKIARNHFGWNDFAIPYWDWVDAEQCEVCTNDLMGETGDYDEMRDIFLLDKLSPFHNWTEYCSPDYSNGSCIGCHFAKSFPPLNRKFKSNSFPKTKDLAFALKHGRYLDMDDRIHHSKNCKSFSVALEGFCGQSKKKYLHMHNRIHNMVRGSFCCASTASNDPLFILHHSQTDRILECWFEIFSPAVTQVPNHGAEPGNSRESNIVGYLPPVKHAQMFTSMANLGIRYDNLDFGQKGFQCSKMAEWIRQNKF